MDCCSASGMPDQQRNRVRAMLKENKSLKYEAKEGKMLEQNLSKVLQPSNDEPAPKESRGRPFERGNPGRPRGSKNRTTRLLEGLMAGEGEKLAQKAVELALAGNVKCLQMCLDRLMPRRAGRPLDFTLPAVKDARDIVAAMAAITTGVNDGSLTAEEAGQLMHILNGFTKALETHDLATRIAALESQKTPMTRDIQRRLQKLESQVPRQPTEQEKKVQTCQSLLMFAMAYYLGDPGPDEAPITAYGRALEYPNSYEFRKAWNTNDRDLYKRDRLARIK